MTVTVKPTRQLAELHGQIHVKLRQDRGVTDHFSRQAAHARECIALCDRSPTKQEVADAEFVLSQKPVIHDRQSILPLKAA